MPTVSIPALHRLTTAIFMRSGAPEGHAAQVADVLTENHLAGHDSHGILRIPQYLDLIKRGQLEPAANPEILQETGSTAQVDACRTFGQVAANYAADLATEKALEHGVSVVSVVRANHTGRLAAFTERGSRRGVGLFMAIGTVDKLATAPFGGRAAAFGTNPISFSMPNVGGPPVTLDYATSSIAAGKIKVAKAEGKPLPPGSVLKADGSPTTDPDDFIEGGFLLPFGGHKGYALAVIAEILAGPFTGADEFNDRRRNEKGGGTGIFLFGMSAAMFRSRDSYQTALDSIIQRIHGVPPAEGVERVLLPGEPEAESRRRREQEGIPVPETTWGEIRGIAEGLGIDVDAPTGS